MLSESSVTIIHSPQLSPVASTTAPFMLTLMELLRCKTFWPGCGSGSDFESHNLDLSGSESDFESHNLDLPHQALGHLVGRPFAPRPFPSDPFANLAHRRGP